MEESKMKKIILFATAITAIVGVVAYFETKKHNAKKEEVLALEKEIKELELKKLKTTV